MPPLLAIARAALPACLPAGAVRLEPIEPTQGFAGAAPYDVVLIEGEVPESHAALATQLAEGGRLVARGRRPDGARAGRCSAAYGGSFTTADLRLRRGGLAGLRPRCRDLSF